MENIHVLLWSMILVTANLSVSESKSCKLLDTVSDSCDSGQVCCRQQCIYGSDCKGQFCIRDFDCSTDQVCCNNGCVDGYDCSGQFCIEQSDCSVGQICCNQKCLNNASLCAEQFCIDDSNCPTGQVCCSKKCVRDLDCSGLYCDSYRDCSRGQLCCDNKCSSGHDCGGKFESCILKDDCFGEQVICCYDKCVDAFDCKKACVAEYDCPKGQTCCNYKCNSLCMKISTILLIVLPTVFVSLSCVVAVVCFHNRRRKRLENAAGTERDVTPLVDRDHTHGTVCSGAT